MQSTSPGCLVVGDELRFYFTARYGKGFPECSYTDAGACMGLATMRRDGFASMDGSGTLTTRPVSFKGNHLFVNLAGELRVEVLDTNEEPIAPFTRENCQTLKSDKARQVVTWKGAKDVAAVSGTPVRFRFLLDSGSLYPFWVTPDADGASYGYVNGGPGIDGPQDLPRK